MTSLDRFFLSSEAFLRAFPIRPKTLCFTNGCFDLLHPGHVKYLEDVRALGDFLVVGLNSDASVARLKGPSRPLQDERARAMVLLGLRSVDAVVRFEEDTPFRLIQALQPDVLAKGGDYAPENVMAEPRPLRSGVWLVSIGSSSLSMPFGFTLWSQEGTSSRPGADGWSSSPSCPATAPAPSWKESRRGAGLFLDLFIISD